MTGPAPREFAEHWRALVGCTIAASIGTIGLHAYTSGAFMPALITGAGYSKEQLSLATLLLSGMVAICAPFAGSLMDRHGPLRIITIGVLGEAAVFGLLSMAPASFPYYAGLIVLLALLGVGTTPPGFARIVTARFDKARGMALGCMISGLGLMAISGPIWATWVITHFGWRAGYATMAGLVLLLGGTGLLLIRSDRHQHPVKVQATVAQRSAGNAALKSPLFWTLLAGFLAPSLFGGGYLLHLISLLQERGFSPAAAAQVQSLIGVAVLAGRLVSGAALDRFPPRWVAAIAFTISAAGCALLLLSDPLLMGIAALAIGLTIGAELDIMAYFISRYFGLANFGRLYGFAYGGLIFAGGASPLLITKLADLGGYSLALIVSTIGTFAGALILLSMPDPRAREAARELGEAVPAE
ncbi:MFS transporter [Sphingomonas sp. So64.6b]|uniref:MFS transporter n=1 Tax=Sphingomonas sp. So64.6b TaxID=2997354 RepID=UPI0015FFB59F|nr:MFS transporter [Sphingomonas sp. So64.6b]QNA86455.1 MFS transporter [Sphingomonas sp. So64.6b]